MNAVLLLAMRVLMLTLALLDAFDSCDVRREEHGVCLFGSLRFCVLLFCTWNLAVCNCMLQIVVNGLTL